MLLVLLLARSKHSTGTTAYQKAESLWSGTPQNQSASLKYYKQAADKGHKLAQLHYARILSNTSTPFSDPPQSSHYYALAALASDPAISLEYGNRLWKGAGVPEDRIAALRYLQMAADGGDPRAQRKFGKILLNDISLTPNLTLAKTYFKRAADAISLYRLAVLHWAGGNSRKAIEYGARSAEKGYLPAIEKLGIWFEAEGNLTRAMEYYARAAEKDSAEAQFRLGGAFARGEGIARNATEAKDWLERAADQGHDGAQELLGEILWRENAREEAMRLFGEFPGAVSENVSYEVARSYAKGDVERNPVKAVRYCRVALKADGKIDAKANAAWGKILEAVELNLARRELKVEE